MKLWKFLIYWEMHAACNQWLCDVATVQSHVTSTAGVAKLTELIWKHGGWGLLCLGLWELTNESRLSLSDKHSNGTFRESLTQLMKLVSINLPLGDCFRQCSSPFCYLHVTVFKIPVSTTTTSMPATSNLKMASYSSTNLVVNGNVNKLGAVIFSIAGI